MIDLQLLDRILRAPGAVAGQCEAERDLDAVARTALLTLLASATTFGASVGAWRGGRQILFAALKMPLGIVGTFVLAAPAFYALSAVFGRTWPLRSVLALMLAAGARFALVLLATTPPLWLTINFGAPYEAIQLAATAAYGLAGLAGLELLLRGIGAGPSGRAAIALFVGVFLLIGAQSAWVLRPYLGAPGPNAPPPFTRAREGGLVGQLTQALRGLGGGQR